MSRLATIALTSAVMVSLLLGLDHVAYAANGKSLLLGRSNSATKTTTIKNSHGTPLYLKGRTSRPPLKVNSSKVVARLNADRLDGKNAADLATAAYVRTISSTEPSADQRYDFPTAPPGNYLVSYTVMADRLGVSPANGKFLCLAYISGVSSAVGQSIVSAPNAYFASASGGFSFRGNPATSYLHCWWVDGGSWRNRPAFTPAQITLTRLDSVKRQ